MFLRPSRLLRDVRAQPEITTATLLLEGVPTGFGTRLGARTAMEGDPGRIRTAGSVSGVAAAIAAIQSGANLAGEIILTY
jgi:hypothetical protein